MLSVSVVVPVRNAARTLPVCLEALARLEPAPAEILLVDNDSTDESLGLLQAFAREHLPGRARVLRESRRGAAAARNAGLRAAQGDVIAFTDSDCAPDPAWLRSLTGPFEDSAVSAVAGRVVAAASASTVELFSALYTLRLPDEPSRHTCWTPWEGGYPTANLAVRRTTLERLEGFDEELAISGEDYDLCARLYAHGGVIAYTPAAKVTHHHRTSLGGMLRQAFGIGRAHPCLLRRHVDHGLWLDLPVSSLVRQGFPGRAWVDLASADKKKLAVLAAGTVYTSALWLLPVYGCWLAISASRRARQAGISTTPLAAIGLGGLLLLKSGAMTAGRWWGSVRYGALCL